MALPTVTITGNVKRPELKYSQSGKAIHKFTLECSEKNTRNEWENLYIDVVTWEKSAEFVNQYFHEGSVAIVTGKLYTKVWENKDGKKQYDISLKFPKVEFAPKDKSGNQPQPQQEYQMPQPTYQNAQGKPTPPPMPQTPPEIDMDDDEIPFAPIGLQYPMSLYVI